MNERFRVVPTRAPDECDCSADLGPTTLRTLRLAGVPASDSAAAQLACRLHDQGEEGLAFRLGGAIDHLYDHFTLTARDREAVLCVSPMPGRT